MTDVDAAVMKRLSKIEQSDKELLERFVVDNPELERLEELLDQFNIFEAIGVIRQEVKHSNFLAFLLNPQQNHGLGDSFLKLLLQKVLLNAKGVNLPVSLIDLDVWSFDVTTVLREWNSIDILLLNEQNKIAVIIENKIGGSEHSNQLQRYHQIVESRYPGWKIIPLYLTPEGESASDKRYLPLSYTMVAEQVESLLERKASTMGADVKTLIAHYAEVLRRHIVSNSEINELCQKIYRKHQRALDLIFNNRPEYEDQVMEILRSFVRENDAFVVDRESSNWLSFTPIGWDDVIGVNTEPFDGNWSVEGRVLLFWISRNANPVRLMLEILPGPSEKRQRIYEIARANKPPFSVGFSKLYPKYCRIWSRQLLPKNWQESLDVEELEGRLREQWHQFLMHDLPKIKDLIEAGMKNGS